MPSDQKPDLVCDLCGESTTSSAPLHRVSKAIVCNPCLLAEGRRAVRESAQPAPSTPREPTDEDFFALRGIFCGTTTVDYRDMRAMLSEAVKRNLLPGASELTELRKRVEDLRAEYLAAEESLGRAGAFSAHVRPKGGVATLAEKIDYLSARAEKAEAESARLLNELKAILAPAEVGGGIVAHFRARAEKAESALAAATAAPEEVRYWPPEREPDSHPVNGCEWSCTQCLEAPSSAWHPDGPPTVESLKRSGGSAGYCAACIPPGFVARPKVEEEPVTPPPNPQDWVPIACASCGTDLSTKAGVVMCGDCYVTERETLRDRDARAAMRLLMRDASSGHVAMNAQSIARRAFEQADAMAAERGKP